MTSCPTVKCESTVYFFFFKQKTAYEMRGGFAHVISLLQRSTQEARFLATNAQSGANSEAGSGKPAGVGVPLLVGATKALSARMICASGLRKKSITASARSPAGAPFTFPIPDGIAKPPSCGTARSTGDPSALRISV